MSETAILQKILIGIGAIKGFRFWRNNAGMAWAGKAIRLKPGQRITAEAGDVLLKNGHPIKLATAGASDILGIQAPHGRMVCLEVKTEDPKSKQTPEQIGWGEMIEKHGGIYRVVRSKKEALAIIASLSINTEINK